MLALFPAAFPRNRLHTSLYCIVLYCIVLYCQLSNIIFPHRLLYLLQDREDIEEYAAMMYRWAKVCVCVLCAVMCVMCGW